jgi:predicted nucleic acid-binding protein
VADFTIVDTDILIDAGRGDSAALKCLQDIELASSLAASVVTQMELLIGCRNKLEQGSVDRFLGRFVILKLSADISDTAVELLRRYRLSHGLLIGDALIAATALTHDRPLISKNQRDFKFIPNLDLLPYP